jgi:hypothetical protein
MNFLEAVGYVITGAAYMFVRQLVWSLMVGGAVLALLQVTLFAFEVFGIH